MVTTTLGTSGPSGPPQTKTWRNERLPPISPSMICRRQSLSALVSANFFTGIVNVPLSAGLRLNTWLESSISFYTCVFFVLCASRTNCRVQSEPFKSLPVLSVSVRCGRRVSCEPMYCVIVGASCCSLSGVAADCPSNVVKQKLYSICDPNLSISCLCSVSSTLPFRSRAGVFVLHMSSPKARVLSAGDVTCAVPRFSTSRVEALALRYVCFLGRSGV